MHEQGKSSGVLAGSVAAPSEYHPAAHRHGCTTLTCLPGNFVRKINSMKTHIENRACKAVGILVLVAVAGAERGFAREFWENPTSRVLWDRGGQPRVEGSLVLDVGSVLKFLPREGQPPRPLALEAGSVLSFQGTQPPAVSIPPLYRVQVGESARISGMLHAVSDKSVTLGVPWQEAEVVVARPGVQAVLQRTGEARVFVDRFDRLIDSRWLCSGKPELLDQREFASQGRRVRLPAGESSMQHRLAEPLVSGRVELSFFDECKVAAGQRWMLDLTFRGPTGPATVRVLLGWAEESLAVECPNGPSLAVQRLARSAGWHRLSLRFGPSRRKWLSTGRNWLMANLRRGRWALFGLQPRQQDPAWHRPAWPDSSVRYRLSGSPSRPPAWKSTRRRMRSGWLSAISFTDRSAEPTTSRS